MSNILTIAALIAMFAFAVWAYSNQACKQARAINVRRLYEELQRRPDLPALDRANVFTAAEIEHQSNLREVIKVHIELTAVCDSQIKALPQGALLAHAGIIAATKRLLSEAKDAIIAERLKPALDHCRNATLKLRELSFETGSSTTGTTRNA